MTEELRALVAYRLAQAEEALASAKADRAAQRLRGAISRAYYAMFYAAMAMLATRRIGTSKHSALVSQVSEQFVKSGPLPAHLGRALNQAFELRQTADYKEFFEPTAEQADRIIAWADEFLRESRRVLGIPSGE